MKAILQLVHKLSIDDLLDNRKIMMSLKASRLWALICLVLIVEVVHSQSFAIVKRQDNAVPVTTPISSSAQPTITDSAGRDQNFKEPQSSSAKPDRPDVSGSVTAAPSSIPNTTSSALPTVTSSGLLDNSTFYNGRWTSTMWKTQCQHGAMLIRGD